MAACSLVRQALANSTPGNSHSFGFARSSCCKNLTRGCAPPLLALSRPMAKIGSNFLLAEIVRGG
jgi:hypothetical protein